MTRKSRYGDHSVELLTAISCLALLLALCGAIALGTVLAHWTMS